MSESPLNTTGVPLWAIVGTGLAPLAICASVAVYAAIGRRREIASGAPLYPGRWAAMIWFYWCGEFQGETQLFNGVTALEVTLMATSLLLFLPLGIIALDRYGRQCWFAWAPDDALWNGLERGELDRRRWIWQRRA